jgi:hypothetical protein
MRWICDPAHGWLEVSFADLAAVGAAIDDFSSYSYINRSRKVLYLEEDCDAARFIARHPQRNTDYFRTLPEMNLHHAGASNPVRSCPSLGDIRRGGR